jgi:hypothetical protein
MYINFINSSVYKEFVRIESKSNLAISSLHSGAVFLGNFGSWRRALNPADITYEGYESVEGLGAL